MRVASIVVFAILVATRAVGQSLPQTPRELVRTLTRMVDSAGAARPRAAFAARLERHAGDREAQFALATLDRLRFASTEADRRYLALANATPVDRWSVFALLGLGQSLNDRSRFPEALQTLDRARELAAQIADSGAESAALGAQVGLIARTANFDSASRLLGRARQLAPSADSSLQVQLGCAEAALRAGIQPARADSLAARGVAMARAIHDRRMVGRCLVIKATTIASLGRPQEAMRSLFEAARVLDSTEDWSARGAAYQHLAFQYIRFSYAPATGRRMASRAIEAADRSGNRLVRAWATLNLAQGALRVGDVRAAVRGLTMARSTMDSLGDRSGGLAVDFVRAEAAFIGGEPERAEQLFRAIVESYRRDGTPAQQIPALLRLAALATARNQPAAAREIIGQAQQIARKSGIALQYDALYFTALIALLEGHYGTADSAFKAFADQMRMHQSYHYVLDAELRRAEALARAGQSIAATEALDSAFAMPDRIWRLLTHGTPNRDAQYGLMGDRRYEFDPDLGLATTLGLLRRSLGAAVAFRYVEAQRARVLLTQMIRRGTLSADSIDFEPRSRAMFSTAVDLEDIERALDDSTALVEFVAGRGDEASLAFVIDRAGIASYPLTSGDSLVEPIQRFVTLLEGGTYAQPLARRLGQLVLDSVASGLSGRIRRLIIVPDGPLHRLPFDALADPSGKPYLERYAISLAPSGRLAAAWLRSAPRTEPGAIVAFGDPSFDPASGLARLPGSATEARHAASRAPRSTLLLGALASEAAFKQRRWEGTSVLHLATHANVEDWGVLSSALHLTPGGGEDGRVGPEEIASLRIPVDLVVLSGCRTVGGVVLFGEGLQGLTAPFLEAGVRTIVATYWAIGDRRMVPLMDRFYRELALGRPVGAALANSKRAALRAGESPASWSALALMGGPDSRPFGTTPARR